jgi:hypothetical protein
LVVHTDNIILQGLKLPTTKGQLRTDYKKSEQGSEIVGKELYNKNDVRHQDKTTLPEAC